MKYYFLLLFVFIIESVRSTVHSPNLKRIHRRAVHTVTSENKINSPSVERIHPKGFRISVAYGRPYDVPSIKIYGTINQTIPKDISEIQPDFSETLTEHPNGLWIYDNTNIDAPVGTSISYVVTPSNKIETATLTGESISIRENCIISQTTVNHKPVCQGELIFEENFGTFNPNRWQKEIRIPSEDEGSPFVSYQDRPENCYVENGLLKIVPTMLSNVSGFNELSIRKGELELHDCIALYDESKECQRKAQNFQILPPIVSAKINTKHSFSFRYGKIVVRTKMPIGDWIVAFIQLDPLENFYGYTNYSSGQLKLAYTRGNEYLKLDSVRDMSRDVYFGPVLSSRYPETINKFARSLPYYVRDFRNITMTWTDESLGFSSDGEFEYHLYPPYKLCEPNKLTLCNRYKAQGPMAPFDKEFYLTLGVSVGGHLDFFENVRNGFDGVAKPWHNYDPKAELNFWNDRNNWYKTWNTNNSNLQIDSIKVYAL